MTWRWSDDPRERPVKGETLFTALTLTPDDPRWDATVIIKTPNKTVLACRHRASRSWYLPATANNKTFPLAHQVLRDIP